MKLYHNPRTRSTRPHWLIEELGIGAERVMLDLASGAHQTPGFLAINPLGQLPALVDGDTVVTESAAICLYLTDAYGAHLKPKDAAALGGYYRWMVYPIGTLEPRIMEVYAAKMAGDEARIAACKAKLDAAVEVVDDAVGDGPWLLGEDFTAADVMLGSTLMWMSMMGHIELPPALQAWAERLQARPAWRKAFAQPGA